MTLISCAARGDRRGPGPADDLVVDDRVDARARQQLPELAAADVGLDELDVAQALARRTLVEPDHVLDLGIGGETAGDLAAEIARDPGDEDAAAGHGAPLRDPSEGPAH
jgi:hypothetical protein